ncbi:MAG: hypothetical protein C5B47_07195 [Verrucomicrobia bacterium]|nr:MAG: hypothetical protein C5B47_07195 [Verrucomicrobiota bacterium]
MNISTSRQSSAPSPTNQTVRSGNCEANSVTLGTLRATSPARRQIETRQTTSTSSDGLVAASTDQKDLASLGIPILLNIPEELHPPCRGNHDKISALALFDAYRTEATDFKNVPLLALKEDVISLRRISKSHNSAQGEVLQRKDLCNIAKDIGYDTQEFHCEDITEFGKTIYQCLKENNPPLVVFLADPQDGNPTTERRLLEECEQAALIIGFDPRTLEVTLAHSGKTYKEIPLSQLYKSMQNLRSTRSQEYYWRVYKDNKTRGLSNPIPKYGGYESPKYPSMSAGEANLLESTIPQEGTGFKNSLFVFTPNPESERWETRNPEKRIRNLKPFAISADVRKTVSVNLMFCLYDLHKGDVREREKRIVNRILSTYEEDRFISPRVLRGFEEKYRIFDAQVTLLQTTVLASANKTPAQTEALRSIVDELVEQLFEDPLTPPVKSPLLRRWIRENGLDVAPTG